MLLKITSVLIVIFCATTVSAQQIFITQGKIEYERKTNQHSFMDENNIWDDLAKKNFSKFITYYFDLTFKDGKTLFQQGRDPETKQNKYWSVFPSENIILANVDSNTAIVQRSIFGDLYQVSDSLRKIEWRITPEIRKIAGFDCRKAVGKIMDSIIVIAFYADDILTSGGPETFTGLPGMILGLAIPRLHTTWYATKLQLIEVTDKDLAAPKKGKKMTGAVYRQQVGDILKQWGDQAAKVRWQFFM
jgi:GLPGLI family protein